MCLILLFVLFILLFVLLISLFVLLISSTPALQDSQLLQDFSLPSDDAYQLCGLNKFH